MLGQAKINGEKIKVDLGFYCYLTRATLGWSEKVQVVQAQPFKFSYDVNGKDES